MLIEGVFKKKLKNGLTVLVRENHSAPVVAIFTYVKAGYFNEPDRLVGISHLIEHMFFKGTNKRGPGQIANETKALGGYLNASTIYDHTLYYTVLPRKNISCGLDIQSDALINSIFNPEELKKETEVVIQEAKRKIDSPSAVAVEKLFELAFQNHRMRRWRIGTEAGLKALTRDDFLTFHKNVYRPENIILVVVGDVNTQKVYQEIEKNYKDFKKGKLIKEESPSEPSQSKLKHKHLTGDIQQSYLTIGFHTPEIFHPDSFALEILAFILGRGRSSRLFQKIKEKRNLVNTISASNYTQKDLGIFLLEANVQPEKLRDAEAAIFNEFKNVRSEAVTKNELIKARNIIESLFFFCVESVSGQASMLAEYEALGDYRLVEEYMQKLYAVTEEDILRVANKYFVRTNCSLLEYLPRNSDIKPSNAKSIESSFKKSLPTASLPDFAKVKENEPTKEIFAFVSGIGEESEVTRCLLSNGTTLLVQENHQTPLVSVGVFAKGGRHHEMAGNAGISALTLRTALKGTRKRTAAEIAYQIENLGTGIQISNGPDFMSFSMNILTKYFHSGFEILADIITEPVFSVKEISKEKENILALIMREKDDMFRHPLKLMYSALFKGHPYGFRADGTPDSIANITKDDLLLWHRGHFTPENLIVVLVGDIQQNKIIDIFENNLARNKSVAKPLEVDTDLNTPQYIKECVEQRDKEQSAMVLGFSGPRYKDAEMYALTVLQNVISGLGGRFFEELRGRQSLAYAVSTFLVSRLYGGAFISYIATAPEKEEIAMKGLKNEFAKLLDAPVTEQELKRAIQYTIGTHQISLETCRAQMYHYAVNEILGRGIEEVEMFPEMIEKVTAEDVLKAARKYFDLNRYALGVVRGNAKM